MSGVFPDGVESTWRTVTPTAVAERHAGAVRIKPAQRPGRLDRQVEHADGVNDVARVGKQDVSNATGMKVFV